jgi:hypothetical protein
MVNIEHTKLGDEGIESLRRQSLGKEISKLRLG